MKKRPKFQLIWWGPHLARDEFEHIIRLGYWRFGKHRWDDPYERFFAWSFHVGPLEIRRWKDG